MSTANIVASNPEDYSITFATRDGGEIQYWYSASDYAAIMSGEDPKFMAGSRTPPVTNKILDVIVDIGAKLLDF